MSCINWCNKYLNYKRDAHNIVQLCQHFQTKIMYPDQARQSLIMILCHLLIVFKIDIFEKKFSKEYHQSFKQFGSRSSLTCCRA